MTCAILVFALYVRWTSGVNVIPVDLSAPSWLTTVKLETSRGGVLSSLAVADAVTAEVVWSERGVGSPSSSAVDVRSGKEIVPKLVKDRIVAMLGSNFGYEDWHEPCLCEFQPQLRLSWVAGNDAYEILISGVSHGEIRTYKNGREQCEIKEGYFIPEYLDIFDALFPKHEMAVLLRRFHVEVCMKEMARGTVQPTTPTGG